ncbi:hypothetical protein VC83_06075 [Pseudogymnoascus destructans]|uniref:Uncharacterized protein n=1 Tax=Pseudogymnoascus destructans TaxID=655981 RepID=A0A177A9Z3_9PEZI|nr:uncharacterized protein VC83_06075 [Pseudogymnoascus destructans]OAF58948.1 hypothetical protein VC83_06075 [Pseudogymnoascus destructans]
MWRNIPQGNIRLQLSVKLRVSPMLIHTNNRVLPAVTLHIKNAERLSHPKSAAVFRFLTVITDGQRRGNIGNKVARHVFHCILQVFIPLIKVAPLQPGHEGGKRFSMPVQGCDIVRLIHQCVSLGLEQHMGMLFGTLDTLAVAQSAATIEGFSLPLLKELDEVPPGQINDPIHIQFYMMAHQVAATIRKQLALHLPKYQDKSCEPQHVRPQPRYISPKESREEDPGCTCKDCLKFAAFTEDPTAKSVKFAFGTESRIAHYKTYQLLQITKGGFQHTCTITPAENSGAESYSITVKKTKTQFAMGTKKGEGSQKTQRLQRQTLRPRPQGLSP